MRRSMPNGGIGPLDVVIVLALVLLVMMVVAVTIGAATHLAAKFVLLVLG